MVKTNSENRAGFILIVTVYTKKIQTFFCFAYMGYYSPSRGRFNTQDPSMNGPNWYVYGANNPIMFIDPFGLENIVVSGGAYYQADSNDEYVYEFIDSALKQIKDMGGDATLLVANAGWNEEQYNIIVQACADRGINLLWFSSVDSLTTYINEGGNGGRENDPITSFTVFAHGTDDDKGNYGVAFGYDTDNDFRWYTSDIQKINSSAFASGVVSTFYSCRTGNNFNNGNFAQMWADKTGGNTYAYSGTNGRSDYTDILGNWWERHGPKIVYKAYNAWKAARTSNGQMYEKPGAAWSLPQAGPNAAMTLFGPEVISPA